MKARSLEFVFGILIISITFIFCLYVLFITLNNTFKMYTISADFSNIGTLTDGSKVVINGYEVGQVTEIKLLYPNYKIHVSMNIKSDIKIPVDSVISIQTIGFLDAPNLSILPGVSTKFFVKNDTISNTKDWMSLEDKIGNVLFNITK